MSAVAVIIAYVVVGCGAAIAIVVQRRAVGQLSGMPAAAAVLFLWPFLLPATFLAEPPLTGSLAPDTERARRIDALSKGVHGAWDDSACEGREQRVLDRYVGRLRITETRLREIDAAIREAPCSVQDKLRHLRETTKVDLDQGIDLLEEMLAQLTLLRFANGDGVGQDERDHVEGLLARIEALTDLAGAV